MRSFSRRNFLGTLAAGGFALAVQPVAVATVVDTPAEGLVTGIVQIPAGDGLALPAYRAMPDGTGPWPIVLVVQEIFGVHAHIRDVCRRLARSGYCAVAPELYFRQGDVSQLADIATILDTVVSKVPDAQVLSDLDAALSWAAGHSQGDAGRAAIAGFCWGGRMAWLYAAHRPSLRAAATWYGRLVGERTPLTPRQPVDIGPSLQVPVLGLYGGADTGIPLDTVKRMRAGIGASGSEIVVYADAPHAFFADYRSSYRQPVAEEAWRRMLDWFRRHGAV